MGLVLNIARHVDDGGHAVMNDVAYKTVLEQREMQEIIGSKRTGWLQRLAIRLGRRLVRPRDVFGIVIKPFMDRYTYDQDRISACCHHGFWICGRLESFCEYNARHRSGDSWEMFPQLGRPIEAADVARAGARHVTVDWRLIVSAAIGVALRLVWFWRSRSAGG